MHGYTTALLAAVFERVIAVDIFAHCLRAAMRHARFLGGLQKKITFLHMDTKADDARTWPFGTLGGSGWVILVEFLGP